MTPLEPENPAISEAQRKVAETYQMATDAHSVYYMSMQNYTRAKQELARAYRAEAERLETEILHGI